MWMVKRERDLARNLEDETEARLEVREKVARGRLSIKRGSL